jgi:hypothetical protein
MDVSGLTAGEAFCLPFSAGEGRADSAGEEDDEAREEAAELAVTGDVRGVAAFLGGGATAGLCAFADASAGDAAAAAAPRCLGG